MDIRGAEDRNDEESERKNETGGRIGRIFRFIPHSILFIQCSTVRLIEF